VKVHDKDHPIEGEIVDLGYFFIHVRTRSGEAITIPNSIMFQKTFSIIEGGGVRPAANTTVSRRS
jgi:small-conductance mechanosensitive channel